MPSGIEIHEHEAFEVTAHRVRRVAWGLLLILIGVALAGFAGPGPLNRVSAGRGRIAVEYSKVGRAAAAGSLRLSAKTTGPFRLWISGQYLDHFLVEDITPAPVRATREHGDRLVFAYDSGVADVVFRLRADPATIGWIAGSAGLEGADQVDFHQIFLP